MNWEKSHICPAAKQVVCKFPNTDNYFSMSSWMADSIIITCLLALLPGCHVAAILTLQKCMCTWCSGGVHEVLAATAAAAIVVLE